LNELKYGVRDIVSKGSMEKGGLVVKKMEMKEREATLNTPYSMKL
jgi:hypothetical protein